MFESHRYVGRHRAPAPASAPRAAAVGALALAVPLLAATPAAADESVWDRVAKCESGGDWSINTGNGYYGGLQFLPSTWRAFGGSGMPHQASRGEQIRVARNTLAVQGPGAWPVCSRKAGLTRENGGATSGRVERARETPREQPREAPREQRASGGGGGTAIPDGYRVKRGDTLSRLAARYDVEGGWRAIAKANGIRNPNVIVVGQRLS